jgi:L-iditol 2-dehydrogenase
VRFFGAPPVDGAFREYVTHPVEYLFKCPEGMTDVQAAMTEPLGIGVHSARIGRVGLGDTVAVIGAGTIGLVTLMAARAAGAAAVFVTDLLENRLALARRLGATDVFRAKPGGVAEAAAWMERATGGRGADVAFECAGEIETIDACVRAARWGGRAVIVGITREIAVLVPMHLARRKELELLNVRRSRHAVRPSIELIHRGAADVEALVTHRFPLERVAEAMKLVSDRRDGVVKAAVVM